MMQLFARVDGLTSPCLPTMSRRIDFCGWRPTQGQTMSNFKEASRTAFCHTPPTSRYSNCSTLQIVPNMRAGDRRSLDWDVFAILERQ